MVRYINNLNLNFLNLMPYVLEYSALNFYSTVKGHPLRDQEKHKRLKKRMLSYIEDQLKEDAEMADSLGVSYRPPQLKEIKKHIQILIKVFQNYGQVLELREQNNLQTGSQREEYPKYFNRNFHFQVDGYTSESSAEIYDHQVEILFAGMAAPMRRLLLNEIAPFKQGNILELACGTGSATEIVARFLRDASITATDMSYEYIQYAKKNRPFNNVTYKQLDATTQTAKADCVYHVFLTHEVPSQQRREILKRQLASLNPGGRGIIVDSLQVGDVDFLSEVLYDFPKYFHEPFYKHYIENPIENVLAELGAKRIKTTYRLFSKCVSFSR